MGRAGSSSSDSGSGVETGGGAGTGCGGGAWAATGCGAGMGGSSGTGFGGGAGVSSTMECLPVVHGGMSRNSSNVRTRGLQQVQPGEVGQCSPWSRFREPEATFLALVEDGWAGVIDARVVRVGERLAAALVHAFLGHVGHCKGSERRRGRRSSYIEARVLLGLFSIVRMEGGVVPVIVWDGCTGAVSK
jgi:hypothetical protein